MKIILGIIILAIVGFFILLIWALCKSSGEADQHAQELLYENDKQVIFLTTCEKCNVEFSWTEKDTLVKENYGATHTIACPKCGKLMKQHIK